MMGFLRSNFPALIGLLYLSLATAPAPAGAQQAVSAAGPGEAARSLAQRVVALIGPGQPVGVTVQNLSSLREDDIAAARDAFLSELESHGTIFVTGDATPAATITLTVSENPRAFLLAAEIRRRAGREVLLASFDRSAVAAPPAAQLFTLRKQLLWTQAAPVLDFALVRAGDTQAEALLVLEPGRVALYRREASGRGAGWTLDQALPLELPVPVPRDLRGRLAVRGANFSVFLPGLECSGAMAPQLQIACEKGEGWWELAAVEEETAGGVLVAGRNFFRGLAWWQPGLPPAERPPEFFSAAGFRRGRATLWLFAGTDGVARLYDSASPENSGLLAALGGWGSQVTGVRSGCGEGWQVLASRPTDWTAPDALHAYQLAGAAGAPWRAAEVAAAAELPGPVVSLNSSEQGSAALAVVRNLENEEHEIYLLTISCDR